MATTNGENAVLSEILSTLKKMQTDHEHLASAVDSLSQRVDLSTLGSSPGYRRPAPAITDSPSFEPLHHPKPVSALGASPPTPIARETGTPSVPVPIPGHSRKSSLTSKIILTTYPGQSGIDPVTMDWGNGDASKRGPVVVSRHPNTIRRRNGMFELLNN